MNYRRYLSAALCCAAVLSTTTLWAAPQYGGRMSGRMSQAQGMMQRGYGKRGDQSSQNGYSNSGYSNNSQPSQPQSTLSKVVTQPIEQAKSVVKKAETTIVDTGAAVTGAAQQVAQATTEKATLVASDASKVIPKTLIDAKAATEEKLAEEKSVIAGAAHRLADPIIEKSVDKSAEAAAKLKAEVDRQLSEKLKETNEKFARLETILGDVSPEELKTTLEQIRKNKIDAANKAIDKGLTEAREKADKVMDAAERELISGVAAGTQMAEKLAKSAVSAVDQKAESLQKSLEKHISTMDEQIAAMMKSMAEKANQPNANHELEMVRLQQLLSQRQMAVQLTQQIMKQWLETTNEMAKNVKP